MTISLFENASFLELIKDFDDYELNIKFEKELFIVQFRINAVVYSYSDKEIHECIKNIMIAYLTDKANEKLMSIEELTNWQTLDELIEEIRK